MLVRSSSKGERVWYRCCAARVRFEVAGFGLLMDDLR